MKMLKLSEVKDITGLSRSTIYLKISEGTFPKQIKLGKRAVAWYDKLVENWMKDCIKNSEVAVNDTEEDSEVAVNEVL